MKLPQSGPVFRDQNLFWKQKYFNIDADPLNNIKIFKNVFLTINIFKNGHIDIDIDIVHSYIEHPFCEMQELPVYGTSFLDEDAQTYKGIALIIAHK